MNSLGRRIVVAGIAFLLFLALGITGLIWKLEGEISPSRILAKVFGIPTTQWKIVRPEAEGLSNSKFEELGRSLGAYDTHALLVIRGGNIVFEWYSDDYDKAKKHGTAAMAKAVTAGPTILLALSEGRIRLDDPLWQYYPALEEDPVRSRILLKHLVYHTAGIENVSFPAGKKGELDGWKAEYYENPNRRFLNSMTVAPVNFTPGAREQYSGVGYYALAYVVTRSIQGSEYDNIYDYLRRKIMRPLGIPDTSWSLSYGKSHSIDGMDLYAFGSGASYTARASARIGELMLNRGEWGRKSLINPEIIDNVLARSMAASSIISENHGWTLNLKNRWPSLPADAFAGLGGGHQITLVVPSLDMVVVRYGNNLSPDEDYDTALDEKLFGPLVECIIGPGSRMAR